MLDINLIIGEFLFLNEDSCDLLIDGTVGSTRCISRKLSGDVAFSNTLYITISNLFYT